MWLIDSNIGLFVYNANEAKFPLLASKERTLFKLFLCDVGLLTHKLCKDNVIKILNGDVILILVLYMNQLMLKN